MIENIKYFGNLAKDEVKYQFSKKKTPRNLFYGLGLLFGLGTSFCLATGHYAGSGVTAGGGFCSFTGGFMLDIDSETRGRIDYIMDSIQNR